MHACSSVFACNFRILYIFPCSYAKVRTGDKLIGPVLTTVNRRSASKKQKHFFTFHSLLLCVFHREEMLRIPHQCASIKSSKNMTEKTHKETKCFSLPFAVCCCVYSTLRKCSNLSTTPVLQEQNRAGTVCVAVAGLLFCFINK